MVGILSVLRDQELNCPLTNYSSIEYERSDVYHESNETTTENAFETDLPVGNCWTQTCSDDTDSTFRFFLDGSVIKYTVTDTIAGNRHLPIIADRLAFAVVKRATNGRTIGPRKRILPLEKKL